jgi:anaerobic selenocysteine-containing dehydrogenase
MMGYEIKRSVCPYDCPDACGLLVHTENEKVVKVMGDPDHPFTRGTLCPKMTHYEKTVHSPLRLTQPLLRTGEKGMGLFRPISWTEAIGQIKEQWDEVIGRYGAQAILPCSYAGTMGIIQRNAGHPFFYRLGASRLERTVCSPAKDYGWQTVMGATPGVHPDEAAASDLIILWGINAVATNIHFLHSVKEAKKHGAKVWLIDTYETPTTALADRVVVVRPGSDGALALGMMHILVRENLVDKKFIAECVQGFAELKDSVLGQYTPDAVSRLVGIDAATIEELARLYAAARAPFIRLGSGLSRYGNGAMSVRTIACLPALVGAWSKLGGGMLSGISTGSALDASFVTREDFIQKDPRSININQLGQALNEAMDPPIMSLYVYVCNPAAILPDQNKILQGLSRTDLFTVVHERFMTDTARYADIILPATSSVEHSDIFRSYGHYAVQRSFGAIPPIGQAKSNWEVFSLLAEAMDFEEPFFHQTADGLIDQMLLKPSEWLARADLGKIKAGFPVELPLSEGYKTSFKTPSGKIEILNPAEVEPLPRYIEPHGDNAPFWLISSPSVYLLNSSFNERADLVEKDEMALKMHPLDAERKGLVHNQRVIAFNERGEVTFILKVTTKAPVGAVVAEGVWWLEHAPGNRSVNALTSQRLTDQAAGSTFYDTKVDVRPE